MENSNEDEYTCPSFSSYSSNTLAEIAVKVVAENSNNGVEDDDDDFEFSLVRDDGEVLSDEFLLDGLNNAPIFPVFNHDLLRNSRDEFTSDSGRRRVESSITVPLSKLLLNDRDQNQDLDHNPPSCSSSEYDELENIPAGTYCVWRPKTTSDQPSPSGCKKSKSTGSVQSRRWKFCDLLRRSNSEGKESLVFLIPKKLEEKSSIGVPKKVKGKSLAGGGGGGAAGPRGATSAHEALYVRNRAIKEEHKKKSFLPYRQDLVGVFVNVNALSKGFPNF